MANIPIISNEWRCADLPKPGSALPLRKRLSQIAAQTGRTYGSLLKEMLLLRFGPGRLSFEEYAGLRLWDNALYANADKRSFVGFKALQKIWIRANYRFDFFGLVNNKITTDILFGTYGFPIMPTIAIYRDQVGRKSPFLLRSDEDLRAFLTKQEHYPLFGKPVSGRQSLGTLSIAYYDAPRERLVTTTGYGIAIDTCITYVKAHAASGYLFQIRVSPHAEVRQLCGDRLATVRLLTITVQGKPCVLRACWKIPAGTNAADNFWRPGNLLGQLDLETGRVLRVVRASDGGFEEISHHPDSGIAMAGIMVPNWREIVTLATEGAKVLEEMALIGWDIAPVDAGAIIVEVNETPDFKLHQLADRSGMLDTVFKDFLKERKRHASDWLRDARKQQKIITELVLDPHTPPASSP